ncbi:MAG: M20/M25/M40 family metallo-hydrolase [Actinobacteria bacterium]|nr:M20/M25/M40 family metallo-hydrolase [Actinomycetota bacterium]
MDYRPGIEKWLSSNSDEILQALSELIKIKTVNVPPGGNEKPGQEYLYNRVCRYIPEKDIDVFEVDDVKGIREHPLFFPTSDGRPKVYKNRPNIVARLSGSSGKRSIAFSGHMDVMPVYSEEWKVFSDPFSGKVKDGKMYGRGSMDMKSGTLAGFMALKCIKELGINLKGDVYAESVVDEENGGVNGTVAARLRYPDIDFAILSEPSGLVAGVETIGGTDWKASVNVGGPGGFGLDQELANPVYRIAKIANALEKYDNKLKKIKAPKTFTDEQHIRLLTFQIYSGGSNYMESGAVHLAGHLFFWFEAFAGTPEEKYRKDFLDFMESELLKYDEFKDNFPKFETVIRFLEGHKTDTLHPAMQSIRKAYSTLGLKYAEKGLGIACDAFAFRKAVNTDVIVIGPEGGNAHGTDEWVDIKSFFNLIKIMVLTAIDYCG